jgi:hypothetical protein
VSTEVRSSAAAWHTADVTPGVAGVATEVLATGVGTGDGLLGDEELLELQAPSRSPAATMAAAIAHL